MNGSAPPEWRIGYALQEQHPPVTRLQLIRYAGASGDFNPIHTIDRAAEEAGLPGVIAHGMLTMASAGRLFSPYLDAGFPQRFEARFVGMVLVGDSLTTSARIVEVRHEATGDSYVFDLHVTNQHGRAVATGSATLLFAQPPD